MCRLHLNHAVFDSLGTNDDVSVDGLPKLVPRKISYFWPIRGLETSKPLGT